MFARVFLASFAACAGSFDAGSFDESDLLVQIKLADQSQRVFQRNASAPPDNATDGSSLADNATDQEVGNVSSPSTGPALDAIAVANEFLAMTLFVIIGCGSAMGVASGDKSSTSWILQVALTFGLAIAALAAATGGQINCAVTFGLWILGQLSAVQAAANVVAQLAGSVLGASILSFVYSVESDKTGGGLGSNGVNDAEDGVSKQPAFTQAQALVAEIVMTFLLMHVVCMTAVFFTQETATLSIGFAVFLAHSVLIPIDGCSINPTRSFGPALVASVTGRKSGTWDHMWVFWLGPLVGAGLAAGMNRVMAA